MYPDKHCEIPEVEYVSDVHDGFEVKSHLWIVCVTIGLLAGMVIYSTLAAFNLLGGN